jgi:F-box/leucine-rich repeat protein 2/20
LDGNVQEKEPVYAIHDVNSEEKQSRNEVMKAAKLEELIVDHDGGDHGLAYVAQKCQMLQELEIHHCTDMSLNSISAFKNLQIMRLFGYVSEYCRSSITDIGLTILARSCNRLVKLDLSCCEGSYDGIAAIGQCCMMLEELTVSNHLFSDGWIAGLSFCSCLKTLRLQNCKQIDLQPGPLDHLGICTSLDGLQLVRCNLRDDAGFRALMMLSVNIRELEIEDCWGLDDNVFSFASACR